MEPCNIIIITIFNCSPGWSYLRKAVKKLRFLFEDIQFNFRTHVRIKDVRIKDVRTNKDIVSHHGMMHYYLIIFYFFTPVLNNRPSGTVWTMACSRPIYRGLQNQGATCYMNSTIQTLFHNQQVNERSFKFIISLNHLNLCQFIVSGGSHKYFRRKPLESIGGLKSHFRRAHEEG